MYVLGCRLSLVRLRDIVFGIIPVDDITIGITCAAFCFHIAHISFASSWYLFCLSVIVLARLCVFGTAMSIKKVLFVFLFIKVMSGQLKGIVLSVSMLRFQYRLKISFSSTYYYYYYYYYYYSPVLIIIIIIIISFMQGSYTYIPETNYVPTEYSVAAILLLLFMVLISSVPVLNPLYFYISTFRSMCAVESTNVKVQ